MIKITNDNVGQVTVSGKFDIAFSVKPDADSDESKTGTMRFVLTDEPLTSIIRSSLKDKRINEQVKMRKGFNLIKDKGIIEVPYEGGRQPIDARTAVKAELQGLTKEERLAYIKELADAAEDM